MKEQIHVGSIKPDEFRTPMRQRHALPSVRPASNGERPEPAHYFNFLVEAVRTKGLDYVNNWNVNSLRAAYSKAFPNHCGYTTCVGNEDATRPSLYTVFQILKEAFPSLERSDVMRPRKIQS